MGNGPLHGVDNARTVLCRSDVVKNTVPLQVSSLGVQEERGKPRTWFSDLKLRRGPEMHNTIAEPIQDTTDCSMPPLQLLLLSRHVRLSPPLLSRSLLAPNRAQKGHEGQDKEPPHSGVDVIGERRANAVDHGCKRDN
jgi:hypothetical protein